MERVKDIKVNSSLTIRDLLMEFKNIGGFQAQEIYRGYEILKEMFEDKETIKVLSFPADIIATGIRGVIKDVIKNRLFDIVITTCGTLDHDIARLEKDYYIGYFDTDDFYLREKGIMRLGNIFIPIENYGPTIETFLKDRLKEIYEKMKKEGKNSISTYEFIWKIGETLENHPRKEESIIYWSYKNKIPMIIPGITDGAVGTQILFFMYENQDFNVSVWEDEKLLVKRFFGDKKVGALILGGGISKHHTIWWAQFSGGLEYAVYISSSVEQDGSLSGAKTKEAITWGKIKKTAKHVNIWGDITIIFPIIISPFL
ncbi:deoxyhypusine synthase [Nanoarchaeota archaeon NZ13-N]|uniref:Deoxyhypusine synthase n=1 Tax=Candidatus Nanoclepta minutus TaxID=1940235 RepID=A0A397WM90_9ARCH|nr:MAG: deoxyhypusine synthase [Nanoarchaeota archaeon NZ13-N]RIB35195.1 MAG: deoxyhypusine synthase [Candidatus Nanoclepta minutus]